MAHILTNVGEEWTLKTALEGVSLSYGLYNDTTDNIGDVDDESALTSEPADGNYVRQTTTGTLAKVSGDWSIYNVDQLQFDVTGTTGTVDSWFIVVSFQADETGDASANDHLIVTGALDASRDLSQIDQLNVDANSAGFKLN